MIETVFWDFGGVFTGSPYRGVERYGESIGAQPGELVEYVFGPYHEDTDHPWHRMERGELSLADTLAAVTEAVHEAGLEDFDAGDLFGALGDGERVAREPVVDKVRELRGRGLRHAIITNNIREVADLWRTMIPMELFDEVIDSSVEAMRKPDPGIFRLALERMGGVRPEETAFLDDSGGNVAAARRLGIHAIHVGEDPAPALVELDAVIARGSLH